MTTDKQIISIDEKSVSITLFIPLCPKAFETKRKNPLIIDNKAVEIIDKLNFDTKPYLQKRAYHSAIVRTYLIDNGVQKFIQENPTGVIINLGCGLDTRISRVDNGQIKWFDLDLPEVIELRKKFFKENERIKFIAKSVTDYSWIDDLKIIENEKILIIAEGLFPYFNENTIKEIFQNIINSFPNAEMYLTVLHTFLIGKEITKGTVFSWGIEDAIDIEKIDNRIKLIEFWRSSDFFKNRQPLITKLFSLITPAGKNMNRVLHIKLGK
jgi:O-methyltransferase involved in polyketide biosynthesis